MLPRLQYRNMHRQSIEPYASRLIRYKEKRMSYTGKT